MPATLNSVRGVPGLMFRVHDRTVTSPDGFRYPPTNRFFFLYFPLAWQPRVPRALGVGNVWCDLIPRFPHWEKNGLASIGKQPRRHVLQMERLGRNEIGWREDTGRAISTARWLSG